MNDLPLKDFEKLKGQNAGAFSNVPQDYFDELPGKIMSGIAGQPERTEKRIGSFSIIGIAAGILALISFSIFLFYQHGHENSDRQLADNKTNTTILKDSTSDTKAAEKEPAADIVELKDTTPIPVPIDTLFTNDLFDELNDIPLEALLQFLDDSEEFEF